LAKVADFGRKARQFSVTGQTLGDETGTFDSYMERPLVGGGPHL